MLQMFYRSVLNPIRDFIYPPICFTCNQLLQDDEMRICRACWNSFAKMNPSHPTWVEIKGKFEAEGVVQDILSCFLFEKEGKLQDVVHLLKYRGMKSLGERLGLEIGERIVSDPIFSRADYLIPVPLHKLKRRERGYNQSEHICKGIATVTNIPTHTALIKRLKYTESQTQLNIDQRKENVGNAFEINPKCRPNIEGKSFILVDDVITTGSTINACARILVANGARNVLAASVALAQ
ncbi:MAG: ComF family protein [Ignavibacteria bacterium]|nr:ComF family protein [Ignavibacteria bacterium]MBI3766570.1 ComF family protein [Ignavibacteriales bacterium]